jgi:hypothetical protein
MAADPLLKLIEYIGGVFDHRQIPYAITGSIASSLHGEPVTSLDVDIVTRIVPEQAEALGLEFSSRMYAAPQMMRQAAELHGMANLYDHSSGYKVDISVLADTPYHRAVMDRRIRLTVDEIGLWIVSPEDIVLMKLLWRIDSRSRKQWENALGVVRVKGHQLDWKYLHQWAKQLAVAKDLDDLMREAGV